MRILTAATRLDGIGGLERAQLAICRQLAQRGHRIDLLYTDDGDLSDDWGRVVERQVSVGGYALSRQAPAASAQDIVAVRRAARRLGPDVIYLHHHRHAPGLVVAGAPVICHMHLPPPARRSRQEMLALRRLRGYIAVSRFTGAQWAQRLGAGVRRWAVVPNGTDVAARTPADPQQRGRARRALGLPADRFLLLYAGRTDPEKGIETALDACRHLDRDRFHLAIAGEPNPGSFGGDRAAAQAYGQRMRDRFTGLPVTWLGRLPSVDRVLSSADLVVVPSHFAEPFGLIVLEALAGGVPVVASAVGALPEILGERFGSSLVPPADPAALAERIRSFATWRQACPELADRGRQLVQERYTVARMGEAVDEALAQLLSDRRVPA